MRNMFTGIIKTTGKVQKLTDNQLSIEAHDVVSDLNEGSSIAVDGVCLTVVELSDETFAVDFMPETAQKMWQQMNLKVPLSLKADLAGVKVAKGEPLFPRIQK